MLRTFIASSSSALATGTAPTLPKSIEVALSTISVSMPELANNQFTADCGQRQLRRGLSHRCATIRPVGGRAPLRPRRGTADAALNA